MNPTSHAEEQRLRELLADRSVFGLDPAEERELDELLRGRPGGDVDGFDRLAAAVAVATARPDETGLPAAVRSRLHDDARRFAQRRPIAAAGWSLSAAGLALLATAACVMIVVGRRAPEPAKPSIDGPDLTAAARETLAEAGAADRGPTPAGLRDEMLATVRDAVHLDCAGAAGGPDADRADGDVVWSPSRQRGFLRVRGLARNVPTESQYQIWIMDGNRAVPVAGGVFNVERDAGDVIVPILPQSFVQGPTMFAVTVEAPGGARDYSEKRARVVARAE